MSIPRLEHTVKFRYYFPVLPSSVWLLGLLPLAADLLPLVFSVLLPPPLYNLLLFPAKIILFKGFILWVWHVRQFGRLSPFLVPFPLPCPANYPPAVSCTDSYSLLFMVAVLPALFVAILSAPPPLAAGCPSLSFLAGVLVAAISKWQISWNND